MKSRLRSVLKLFGIATVLTANAAPALAAQRSGMSCDAGPPRLLLTWIKAPDRQKAIDANREARAEINAILPNRVLCIIPKEESDRYLTGSGFPTTEVLPTSDIVQLSTSERADEFLQLEMKVVGSNYQLVGMVVLPRDSMSRDRIPDPEPTPSISGAARQFARSFQPVFKQVEHERKCYNLRRDQKYAEAEAEAKLGLKEFPEGVIARLCLASAMQEGKKSPDDVLTIVQEVLKRDSTNVRALTLAYVAYDSKKDAANFTKYASQVIALDPGNSKVEEIIDELINFKQTDLALQTIDKVMVVDPDNKILAHTQFNLLYRGNRYKEAAAKGEVLAKLDTAAVDTLFILRMAGAYTNDSQPERVKAWLAIGAKKFPANAGMAQAYAQTLGKTPDAVEAYKKLLAVAPQTPDVRLQIADIYNELGQADSTFAWLHRAAQGAVDDKGRISKFAYSLGGKQFNAANAAKNPEEFKKVVPFVAFADSVQANNEARMLWGLAAYSIGGSALSKMTTPPDGKPTCELAKDVVDWFLLANEKLRAGASANPTQAAAIIPKLQEYIDYGNGQLHSLHCPGS